MEWSGAVAPGATIDFVVAESTETTQGIHLSALHIIDNNLAPVMSESYGQCELFIGTAGNQFFAQLWQQAAAQGITVMIASGDQGSAVCDRPEMAAPAPAKTGLEVSGYASTPYNVAVGGTDFADLTNAATYWNTTNNSITQASALSYIPESTWNDSCTNAVFGTLLGFSTNPETNCNNPRLLDFVETFGGSGGKSSCISSDGQSPSTCAGGYPKPAWQSSLTPNDGARDVPDVSLFAAVGLAGSFYVICEADQSGAACNPNAPTADFLGAGGTSASAPAFAGIMALVNQETGSRQGNANYVLYKLATQQPSAFHDVTTGTIAMPCQTGSPNCTTSKTGDAYGILSGYNAVAGYDLATGLGSVNAFNLVTKWNSVTLLPSATTLSSLTPTTITHGQPVSVTIAVAPQSGTGTPAGLVALVGGPTGSVTDFDSHTLSSGGATWTTSLLPGGSYNVTAHYPGDGNYSSSDSATGIPVIVNKENSKVALGLVTYDFNGNLISSNATTATYGSPYLLRVGVTGATCSSNSIGQAGCPSGNVTLTDNGNPLDAGTYTLNNLGYTEDLSIQLSGGQHMVQAGYAGDNSFNLRSLTSNLSITPVTTTIGTPYVQFSSVGQNLSANVTINAPSFGAAPTGVVTFLVNGQPITGTVSYSGTAGSVQNPTASLFAFFSSSSSAFPSPGTYAITASYSGDSNYAGSASQASSVTVKYPNPFLSISPTNVTVVAGVSVTISAMVDTNFKNAPVPTGTVPFIFWGPMTAVSGTETYTPTTDSNGNVALQASITFVPAANASITASYGGDANYPSAAGGGLADVTVTGSDFALVPMSPSMTLSPGQQGPLSIFVQGQSNYNGTINFNSASCSGLPKESACTFSPASVTGAGSTNVSVSTTGYHLISLRGNRIGWMVALWVPMAGLMLISTLRQNKHLVLLMVVAILLVGLPSCGGGSSSTVVGGGSGGGSTADPGTPKGTYTITVTATSGSLTHTANFQLVVQ